MLTYLLHIGTKWWEKPYSRQFFHNRNFSWARNRFFSLPLHVTCKKENLFFSVSILFLLRVPLWQIGQFYLQMERNIFFRISSFPGKEMLESFQFEKWRAGRGDWFLAPSWLENGRRENTFLGSFSIQIACMHHSHRETKQSRFSPYSTSLYYFPFSFRLIVLFQFAKVASPVWPREGGRRKIFQTASRFKREKYVGGHSLKKYNLVFV